jgi:hypothetical protein
VPLQLALFLSVFPDAEASSSFTMPAATASGNVKALVALLDRLIRALEMLGATIRHDSFHENTQNQNLKLHRLL